MPNQVMFSEEATAEAEQSLATVNAIDALIADFTAQMTRFDDYMDAVQISQEDSKKIACCILVMLVFIIATTGFVAYTIIFTLSSEIDELLELCGTKGL